MRVVSKGSHRLILLAMLTAAPGSVLAQSPEQASNDINVYGQRTEGPEIKGHISARTDDKLQITTADGSRTVVLINDATRIKASSGLFGSKSKLAADSLLNGLPVTVKTWQREEGLVANQINFRNSDLKTATMIRSGTDQRFAQNEAATEALRGRMADIDKYNLKSTTNVNFDTGKFELSMQAKQDLCAAAATADATDNALLLVIGYTDSVGDEEYNQVLSEKRASRVVNYLQQACGWKPYRMLTPTGMAEADPLGNNDTDEGKAQNRRVAVNVLVSKSVDGI
jgi:OOP family OmpA-OmpF porin